MIQFQEDALTELRKDEHNLFHIDYTITIDWHLKVKDIDYNVSPTKTH